MKRPKVLVLGGGHSPEREVSLRSSNAVLQALKTAGYYTNFYDPLDASKKVLGLISVAEHHDVILPILHGVGGEDGVVQDILEGIEVPFLGTGSIACAHCFDKVAAREILETQGFKIPKGVWGGEAEVLKFISDHPAFVLKPARGGSSIDTLISPEGVTDQRALEQLLQKYGCMLVEEYIKGLEVTVPILGKTALSPLAIIPPLGSTFDFDNKYNGLTQEICPIPPDLLSAELLDEAIKVGEQVHDVLGARHISRADIIITPEGEINVLELNTMPGLTDQSLYPRAALYDGMDMPTLVTRLVDMALGDTDNNERASIRK